MIVGEPWQRYDDDGNGSSISDIKLLNAIMDWIDGNISYEDLLNVK